MRHGRDLAPASSDDVMFQPLQDEAVQVDEIAREVGLDDLPGAVSGVLAAKHEPRKQQHAVLKLDSRLDNHLVALEAAVHPAHLAQRCLFLARQVMPAPKLANEQLDVDAHADKSAQGGVRSAPARFGLRRFRSSQKQTPGPSGDPGVLRDDCSSAPLES
jgi:hypothetical protein